MLCRLPCRWLEKDNIERFLQPTSGTECPKSPASSAKAECSSRRGAGGGGRGGACRGSRQWARCRRSARNTRQAHSGSAPRRPAHSHSHSPARSWLSSDTPLRTGSIGFSNKHTQKLHCIEKYITNCCLFYNYSLSLVLYTSL